MAVNAVGREIPDFIEGYGKVKQYQGAFARRPEGNICGPRLRCVNGDRTDKRVSSLKEAIIASGLRSGMRVVAYDPFLTKEDVEKAGYEFEGDLYKALGQADLITLHMPLTKDTKGMADVIGNPEFQADPMLPRPDFLLIVNNSCTQLMKWYEALARMF